MGEKQDFLNDAAFGCFRLDVRSRSLSCDGQRVPLRSRSLEILWALVDARGNLVTKDELMARVWPGTVVGDNALQVHISALRKALGEDVGSQRHIVTVPGYGYRFVEQPVARQANPVSSIDVAPPLADRPSIAVLRFENLSSDPEQDYFADGVVEDIITALARIPSLLVIARNSSLAYKGRAIDVRQIGREWGVRYVLEGSVRKAGARLRISGQLIQAETGIHLWAGHFDGSTAEIFSLQDELTASVVGALLPSLQRAEIERARRKPPESLSAYDLYLRALAGIRGLTREGVGDALQLLEQALRLDPTFATAAMLAGVTWAVRVNEGWSPVHHAQSESLRYLRLAVRLDPHEGETLAVLARFTALYSRDYAEARLLAQRAVALNPNSARVWRATGWAYDYMGEPDLALEHLQRGLHFHPRDAGLYDSWSGIAFAFIQLERDQDALVAARNAIRLNAHYTTTLRVLASSLALVGDFEEARDVVRKLVELDSSCSIAELKRRFCHSERASTRFFDGLRRAGLPE